MKSGGDSTALVTTGVGFMDITVRKGIVYWAESNFVRKVSATGGDSITLTSDNHAGFSSIAVDDAFVYVENYADATIARVPLDGGAREKLAKDQTTPHGLTVDGTSLYWGANLNDNTQDRVVRGSITGNFITPLTSSVNATNFAVDEQYVYWTSVNEGEGVPSRDRPRTYGVAVDGRRFLLRDVRRESDALQPAAHDATLSQGPPRTASVQGAPAWHCPAR